MVGDSNDLIRPIRSSAFLIANSHRLTVPKMIPAPSVFRGMERQDTFTAPTLFGPDHCVADEPIVRVNDVERADVVLRLKEMVDERPAHIVDFIYEVGMKVEWTAMVMNTVDPRVMRLPMSHPCEYVDFVSFALKCCRQFGDMNANSAHCNRMQRFPGKHRDSHNSPAV